MGAKEERDERNQQIWLARSEKERQDLSLSVEEALDDPILQELFWSDEDDEFSSVHSIPHGKSLFPPRLSLQSRMVGAVNVERKATDQDSQSSDNEAIVADRMRIDTMRADASYENIEVKDSNTNTFMRFAQRLTSSFSAIGSSSGEKKVAEMRTDISAQRPSTRKTGRDTSMMPVIGRKASSLASIADVAVGTTSTATVQPLGDTIQPSHPDMRATRGRKSLTDLPASASTASLVSDTSGGAIHDSYSSSSSLDDHAGLSVRDPLDQVSQKKRLAGRNTRVRLEVVSRPRKEEKKAKVEEQPSARYTGIPQEMALSLEQNQDFQQDFPPDSGIQTDFPLSPVVRDSVVPVAAGQMTLPLPAVSPLEEEPAIKPVSSFPSFAAASSQIGDEVIPEKKDEDEVISQGLLASAARGTLSGSGFFEDGQEDATVANTNVTEKSVVLITLTSSPGPVVVQYVTLQPQVGFTVHLTAPTTMRASFNYIILLGELF